MLHNCLSLNKTITSLSFTELKAFTKHKYKEIMIKEMKTRLPTYKNKIIRDSCHCIFNAFNNKYQKMVGERKRDRTKSNQQLSTTVKSTEKQTKNNHQSVRSDHIYDDI